MNKLNKVLTVFCIFLFVIGIISPVFGVTVADPGAGTPSPNVSNITSKVWGTIVTVVQVAAIAAIVFAGVRYMFASADQKADIKKQTVILIVGAVLVFAAVPVAEFISKVASDIF